MVKIGTSLPTKGRKRRRRRRGKTKTLLDSTATDPRTLKAVPADASKDGQNRNNVTKTPARLREIRPKPTAPLRPASVSPGNLSLGRVAMQPYQNPSGVVFVVPRAYSDNIATNVLMHAEAGSIHIQPSPIVQVPTGPIWTVQSLSNSHGIPRVVAAATNSAIVSSITSFPQVNSSPHQLPDVSGTRAIGLSLPVSSNGELQGTRPTSPQPMITSEQTNKDHQGEQDQVEPGESRVGNASDRKSSPAATSGGKRARTSGQLSVNDSSCQQDRTDVSSSTTETRTQATAMITADDSDDDEVQIIDESKTEETHRNTTASEENDEDQMVDECSEEAMGMTVGELYERFINPFHEKGNILPELTPKRMAALTAEMHRRNKLDTLEDETSGEDQVVASLPHREVLKEIEYLLDPALYEFTLPPDILLEVPMVTTPFRGQSNLVADCEEEPGIPEELRTLHNRKLVYCLTGKAAKMNPTQVDSLISSGGNEAVEDSEGTLLEKPRPGSAPASCVSVLSGETFKPLTAARVYDRQSSSQECGASNIARCAQVDDALATDGLSTVYGNISGKIYNS